jgi:hypothetical protein
LLNVPFSKGLGEKSEGLILPVGNAAQASNYAQDKMGHMGKTIGYAQLGQQATFVKRLGTFSGQSIAIAQNGSGDMLTLPAASTASAHGVDFVPEAYVMPKRVVAGFSSTITDVQIAAADMGVIPAHSNTPATEVFVFTEARNLYYTASQNGVSVVPPTPVPGSDTSGNTISPRVIICGNTAVISCVVTTTTNVTAFTLGFTGITPAWGVATNIITDLGGPNGARNGVYDTKTVDDNTAAFVVGYIATVSNNTVVKVKNVTASTLVVTATGTLTDANLNGGGVVATAVTLRASVASSNCYLAYAYTSASNVKVFGAGMAYPGLASTTATPVDLQNGQTSGVQPPSVYAIDIVQIPATSDQQVVYSPGTVSGTPGPYVGSGASTSYASAAQNPLTAVFVSTFFNSAGTGTLRGQQPRWTNGCILASRQALVANPVTGLTKAYVCTYFPSNNPPSANGFVNQVVNQQGSYFLMAIDTMADYTTTHATWSNAGVVGTNQPMRWVGTLAARTALSNVTAISLVLPHFVPDATNLPTSSGGVWGTVLPINLSPLVASPVCVQVDFASTHQYQTAELGGLTGFASGVPFATDGGQVFEYAYPYYPENIKLTAGVAAAWTNNGSVLTGSNGWSWSYIATYERWDNAGNRHRSGRSVPVNITVPQYTLGTIKTTISNAGQDAAGNPIVFNGTTQNTWAEITANGAVTYFTQAHVGQNFLISNASVAALNGTYAVMAYVSNTNVYIAGVPSGTVNTTTFNLTAPPAMANVVATVPTMGFSYSQHGYGPETQNPTIINLYRTLNAGGVYYNTASNQPGSPQGFAAAQTNDLAKSYANITDTTVSLPDNGLNVPAIGTSAIQGISVNEQLYGDGTPGAAVGGILDNLTPPAFQGLIVHKNRWWGFEGSNVWYSKAYTSGEGPGFNELMAFSVDEGAGPITGLSNIDEKLLIFKRDRIFYVTGDGPDSAGRNNDLQPPQKLNIDSGCVDWRSIVVAPTATWYLSDAGLYTLDRKMAALAAGKHVEDELAANPIVVGSALDPVNGQIKWALLPTESNSVFNNMGEVLLYDYMLDIWTVLPYFALAFKPITCIGQALAPNNLTVMGDAGGIMLQQQTPSAAAPWIWPVGYLSDSSQFAPSTWQSPWIRAADLQGFQRWWWATLLWTDNDPHALKVQVAYNYNPTPVSTYTITHAQMLSHANRPNIQHDFEILGEAQSVQLTVSDAQDNVTDHVTGRGATLVALTLAYGTRGAIKTYPVPVTQRN